MIKQECRIRGLEGKPILARVYGLVICRRNGNLVIGIGLGKISYFWEFVK